MVFMTAGKQQVSRKWDEHVDLFAQGDKISAAARRRLHAFGKGKGALWPEGEVGPLGQWTKLLEQVEKQCLD